ncbi:MAG: glycosyltransferase [Cyclobacteriaceae bacterium]|nr:glycosyltransferase [Cyclobacteriaceae bacterium]
MHGTEENFGLIQFHTEKPVVISIQGILNPYKEKYHSGIPQNVVLKYEGLVNKILKNSASYNLSSFQRRAVREREILLKSKYIIGRTEWDKSISKFMAPNSQYFTGQEMLRDAFYLNSWKKRKLVGEIKIATVTSNGLYKGYETIVKTCLLLKNYEIAFKWKVIGINVQNSIVQICHKWLGVSPADVGITLLGSKDDREIVETLIHSDIYCQVSHIENSPNSLCEAQILGVPIIASNVGGTNTLIRHNVNGVLVQDGEPYFMASKIKEYQQNPDKYIKMAKNGQKMAQHRHNRIMIVSDLLKTYQAIVQN